MRLLFVLLLALFCDGCITCMPPTTAVQVVDTTPEGAKKVGLAPFQWEGGGGGDCRTPPEDVVARSERMGAEFLVIEHHDGWGLGAGKTVCRAWGYVSSDTKPVTCH